MYATPYLMAALLLAKAATAQAPPADTTRGTSVTGIVTDSVARVPLPGARIQLVSADAPAGPVRGAETDSLGRFRIPDVPNGRYMIGFLHPLLDSLGVEPPPREVYVVGGLPVRMNLSTPSPSQLRAAICTPRPDSSGRPGIPGGLVIGVVRDVRGAEPAAGAAVTAEWLEMSIGKQGLFRRIERLAAKTGENGWFALCNVPVGGTMMIGASRGPDSTDTIEIQVPAEGFVRRELHLGPATIIAGRGGADSLPELRRRGGEGRLTGRVVAVAGDRPLGGAQVRIVDGPWVRADAAGDWTLSGVPEGTRMLEVRAVGYYPERRAVDVIAGTPPMRIALLTMKAMLDTVRVTAARLSFNHTGFAERSRTGQGRYLGPDDIARRFRNATSDLFANQAGLRVERSPDGGRSIMVSRAGEHCVPAVYLDGMRMDGLDADMLDAFVAPGEIGGIEIYVGTIVPPQFQSPLASCGSLVIWTKRS